MVTACGLKWAGGTGAYLSLPIMSEHTGNVQYPSSKPPSNPGMMRCCRAGRAPVAQNFVVAEGQVGRIREVLYQRVPSVWPALIPMRDLSRGKNTCTCHAALEILTLVQTIPRQSDFRLVATQQACSAWPAPSAQLSSGTLRMPGIKIAHTSVPNAVLLPANIVWDSTACTRS